MKVLALDISTKAGFAFLDGEMGAVPKILVSGKINLGRQVHSFGTYPGSYAAAAMAQVLNLIAKVKELQPDTVVVEETNLGKNRYSQKVLEFIHGYFVWTYFEAGLAAPLIYVSSSKWRQAVELEMSKEDKKNNKTLNALKKAKGGTVSNAEKAAVGVAGKVNKKHLAVRKANELWGLKLILKDNDEADALLLGTGYLLGAEICDGT